jgi:hypothetical protein
VANKVPLDQMNPPLKALRGKELDLAKQSLALDFDDADQGDEDTLNRILWHSVSKCHSPANRVAYATGLPL